LDTVNAADESLLRKQHFGTSGYKYTKYQNHSTCGVSCQSLASAPVAFSTNSIIMLARLSRMWKACDQVSKDERLRQATAEPNKLCEGSSLHRCFWVFAIQKKVPIPHGQRQKHAASENPPPSLWPTAWKDAKNPSPRIERDIEGKNFYLGSLVSS